MQGPVSSIILGLLFYGVLHFSAALFGGLNELLEISIVVVIVFIRLISFIVERIKSTRITRNILNFCEVLLWLVLMYGILTIIVYIVKLVILIPESVLIALYGILIPILAIYAYVNAHRITIKEHTLYINNLTEELDIIHVSDLHIGSIHNKSLLNSLVVKINPVEADIVIISGDLADGSCPITEDMFMPLKDSNKPIFFVYGNHDYYMGIDPLDKATENANITTLRNEMINFKGLNIYGLPFSFSSRDQELMLKNIKGIGDKIDSTQANLLVFHIPSNWEYFSSIGFDIQLSGHTHGGQFYPMTFLIKLMFPYSKGLFKKDNSYLSVTAGLGTFSSPMRWGTNCELVLLHLKRN
jgi:predicted MPP superfamily phosphohydrolase